MKKTVLITGASRGIGAATARLFAQNGYQVVINYLHSKDSALALESEINSAGLKAISVRANVQNKAEIAHMLATATAHFSNIDVLINNAGIAQQKLFTDITDFDWDEMFGVNIKGIFNCTQAVLPQMIRNHCGKIVNISSMWGVSGASCEVHYSAAKSAVIGFTKALAKEVGPSNINVNCIAPGVIDTDMNALLSPETLEQLKEETPLCRLGTADDIAKLALFLSSEQASFITGQVITADGGMI